MWPFKRKAVLYTYRPPLDSIETRPLATRENIRIFQDAGYKVVIETPPMPEPVTRNAVQITQYLETRNPSEPIILGYLARGGGGRLNPADRAAYERLAATMYADMEKWIKEAVVPTGVALVNPDFQMVKISDAYFVVLSPEQRFYKYISPITYQTMYRSIDIFLKGLEGL